MDCNRGHVLVGLFLSRLVAIVWIFVYLLKFDWIEALPRLAAGKFVH